MEEVNEKRKEDASVGRRGENNNQGEGQKAEFRRELRLKKCRL
jgi:hypothetical protein